jgi:hypothetical protein
VSLLDSSLALDIHALQCVSQVFLCLKKWNKDDPITCSNFELTVFELWGEIFSLLCHLLNL